ncbi:type VI secretion system lipoprotein TssJ, partial [Klebsiella pneumoniae]|nr:type VI secretion system lipoprotein TssJ [Klebsiella pneumoniae]
MAISSVKPSSRLLAFLMVTLVTGCGLTQTVKDGAVSVSLSIFYPQVKSLHLDLL